MDFTEVYIVFSFIVGVVLGRSMNNFTLNNSVDTAKTAKLLKRPRQWR